MTPPHPTSLPQLRTLGPAPRLVRVAANGDETLLLGPGKPIAMLVYLSMLPDRTTSRIHLTDLLWADSDLERARQSLRQAIWQVRQKLGERALVGTGEQLILEGPLSVDYHEVGAALRDGRLEEAVRLYVGDFLSEFGVPGGTAFEHWADMARERLRAGRLKALEALAKERRAQGALREAIVIARRLRDADPHREAAWRFLMDTLLLAGDQIGASLEADALDARLAAARREPEPQTTGILARVRAIPPVATSPVKGGLTAELIGREGEFSRLTQGWDRVRTGAGRHIHVSAPAGLGKTRLLQDAEHRLRAVGGRVVYLRASSGSRQIAYSFAADLARAMSTLPGAAGVSPSVIATLLALDPSLATRYSGAPDLSEGSEALRRRTLALADMISALSEDSPLALLLDDVHWADSESLRVLAGLLSRIGASSTLLVTTARPFAGSEALEGDAELLSLAPLVESQVEALVLSLGSMPEAQWSANLIHHLHDASGGSPHVVLESLQFALDGGWLSLGEQGWSCRDASRIAAELTSGDAIRRRLNGLDSFQTLLLTHLAIAATELPAKVLAQAAGIRVGEAVATLTTMELRGFVSLADGRWRLGHDQIAEALLQGAAADSLRLAQRALGTALALEETPSLLDVQRAAELLIAGGDEAALAPLYLRWLTEARRIGDPRSDGEIARLLLGASATPVLLGRILRARPLHRRLGLVTPRRVWSAAAGAVAAMAIFASAMAAGGHRPSRIVLLQAPLAGTGSAVVPNPVIEIQDRSGRRIDDSGIPVHVEAIGSPGAVIGTTTVPTRDGLATFDHIGLGANLPSQVILRFTAESLEPVHAALLGAGDIWLRLDHGDLNGQAVSAKARTLRTRPGERIVGTLTFRYSAPWSAASVLLMGIPTWGEKQRSFATIGPLATPAKGAVTRQEIAIPGPVTPGDYRLLFAFAAETEGVWIASGTNWKVGRPVWNDGNDLADLPEREVAQLDSTGHADGYWLFEGGRRVRSPLGGTSILVQVR